VSDILQRDLSGFRSDIGHLHRRLNSFHPFVKGTLFSGAWCFPHIMAFTGTPLRRLTNEFDEAALDQSVDEHTKVIEYYLDDLGAKASMNLDQVSLGTTPSGLRPGSTSSCSLAT
jgi:hypothetical protein